MPRSSFSENTLRSHRAAFLRLGAICLLAGVALLALPSAQAERLPVRQYTIADGLPNGSVNRIYQDARGFLWLATSDGLSRFDGYQFINYGVSDGIGHTRLNDVVADRHGRLWVGTYKGVSVLLSDQEAIRLGKKFMSFRIAPADLFDPNIVNKIAFDHENRMWCLTDAGLYRSLSTEVVNEQFERVAQLPNAGSSALYIDRKARIWAATRDQFISIADGKITRHEVWKEAGETPGFANSRYVMGVVEAADGKIYLATQKNLYEFVEPAARHQAGKWRRLPLELAPLQVIGAIQTAVGGGLWIGTQQGLIRYQDGQQLLYRIGNSPNPFNILTLFNDRDGNLLIGTAQTGLLRLAGEGIAIFDSSDGLAPVREVYYVGATHDGRVKLEGRAVSGNACNDTYFTSNNSRNRSLQHFKPPGLCIHQILQDQRKNWWVMYWLPKLKTYRVRFIPGPDLNLNAGYDLTPADGWVDGDYSNTHEDKEGNLWFKRAIDWHAKTGEVYRVEYGANGRPHLEKVMENVVAVYLARLSSGTIWMSEQFNIWRYRNGKTEKIEFQELYPDGYISQIFADSRNHVWLCAAGLGVFKTEEPEADHPRFVRYNASAGLPSNYVAAISEDDDGRIYLGTSRGLYVLDAQTGKGEILSFGDQSIGSVVRDLQKDRQGNIWASVVGAVIRINPKLLSRLSQQNTIYFNRITIAGETQPIGEAGISSLTLADLPPSRNNLSITFVSPNFRDESSILYQHQLEGANSEWSPPSPQREVHFANLAPGTYRFRARALDALGKNSEAEAILQFRILRPVWQRWWFITLAAVVAGLTALAFYRSRVKRIVELERMRTRIATDLHDDIGSSLSQIAILSEVSRRRVGPEQNGVGESLAQIANTSRDLVDTMSDIVWAINPRRDRLSDLVQRMREFAGDVFTAREIEFSFHAPSDGQEIRLDADVRRQLYLIFKEAVNNAARHARCTEAEIEFEVAPDRLLLRVRDNGRGFDPNGDANTGRSGNGLASMRERARAMGGEIEIVSQPNLGTAVKLDLPLDHRWRR